MTDSLSTACPPPRVKLLMVTPSGAPRSCNDRISQPKISIRNLRSIHVLGDPSTSRHIVRMSLAKRKAPSPTAWGQWAGVGHPRISWRVNRHNGWRHGWQRGQPTFHVYVEGTARGQFLELGRADHIPFIEGHQEAAPAANPVASAGNRTGWNDSRNPPHATSATHLRRVGNGAGASKIDAVRAKGGQHFRSRGLARLDETDLGISALLSVFGFGGIDRDGRNADTATQYDSSGSCEEQPERPLNGEAWLHIAGMRISRGRAGVLIDKRQLVFDWTDDLEEGECL